MFDFGDDSSFLSGLGIDVKKEAEKKEEVISTPPLQDTVSPVVETTKPKVVKWVVKNAKVISKAKKETIEKPSASILELPKKEKKKKRLGAHISDEETPWSKVWKIKTDEMKKKPDYNKNDIVPSLKEARVIRKAPSKPAWEKKKWNKDVDDLIAKKTKNYMVGIESSSKSRRNGNRRPWWYRSWGRSSGIRISSARPTSRERQKLAAAKKASQNIVKRVKTYKVSETLKKKETITLPSIVTVKEFSEKMWVPLPEVMKVLLTNGIIVAAHASIDLDTAQLVASEFEVTVVEEAADVSLETVLEANLDALMEQDRKSEDAVTRPPVVTIMGHVDHGKTKLLDYFRQTDVVGGEAGGITQSIWASQITHSDQKITFIDTPWHELFSSLRARWSKITNIVVIVVAADDGVKPQTVEAIRHAKDANVPIIVAITKIDLGIKKMDEIKWQLAEHQLVPEEWGGETILVPCSAITGQGIDDLLDMILLQTEMLELKCNPNRAAVWVVVESHKDPKIWVHTSMLMMTGTLRVWDILAIHNTYGRVRRMMDWAGNEIKEAQGGQPVMILGINDVPEPGRIAEATATDKEAQKKIALIQEHQEKHKHEVWLQSILDKIGQWEKVHLKLILKADSFGSLEALKHACTKIPMPENIEINVIHDDVWGITDGDMTFARAANAVVIGYNLPLTAPIRKKATQRDVTLKQFDIIYEFMEYIEDLSKWLIEIEQVETLIGKMNVLKLFFKKWKDMIVWGKIIEWRAQNHATFKVMRWIWDEEEQVANGRITSLKRDQENVKIVKEWYECGIKVRTSKKIQESDIIEFYMMEDKID